MKLLANENVPLASVLYLRKKGFDVMYVGTDFSGYQDHLILELAQNEGRTIITFDRDYGELIFKYQFKPLNGIIYLRLDDYTPEEPGKIVEKLIEVHKIDFQNTLTVFDKHGLRQRKY
jgi:predicted nuclease of predicted toxin-antitoxin system